MKYLIALFSCLFLGACAHFTPQPLQMPERFLGTWDAHNIGVFLVLNVLPDVILHEDPQLDLVRYREYYKVVRVEDKYVYLIVKSHITKEWAEYKEYHNSPKEIFDSIMQPYYEYRRYHISPYLEDPKVDLFVEDDQICALGPQDWDLPTATHWNRINSEYCKTIPNGSYGAGFRGHRTWSTGKDRRLP